ncbi:MAG TPA: SDR family NAD(P)-dependent oxidoreductase [Candidatus Saccharimonadales bacterium]|nr:SDR family NAD(P)-dependent oxidoreductase [Candidatus Saccharimonadales bacterium]
MGAKSEMEIMERLKNKTVLVTGGAGFIGGHLTKKLLTMGFKVVVVDIGINPRSIFYLEKLKKSVAFENADVRDRKRISTIFKKYKPSFVFHLAAEPIVEKSFESPYETLATNIMGTVSVLEAARSLKNITGVIVASSDKAYGKTKKAYTEDSPLRGDHPYDVSKSAEDLIAQAYAKTYGLPIVITRFGNVYGEGDFHKGRIIPDICEAIIKKKTLKIRSDGKYVRDYIYVEDVVNGYTFLLQNIKTVKGQAFNFSSKDSLSVLELIKKTEKLCNVKISYTIQNTAKNEIPYQHLNDRKVRKLGWKNTHNFENSFVHTLAWYKKYL